MVSYITTAAFRTQGLGVDLTPYSDEELRSILQAAAARVNAYTSAPNLPQPHDFRGGTITDERHEWDIGGQSRVGTRRVRPWHQPVKSIDSFRILVTEGNYIVIQPDDMFINNSAGYVEVVALTLGIGIFPVLANLSLSQPVSSLGYTYGSSFPVAGEELLETDGQTFRAANQWWNSTVTPKVYINGTDHTTDFTLDYNEGTATYSSELDAGDVVSADYNYRLFPQIARASAVIAADMIGQARIRARGLTGLSSIRVAPGEIELRQGGVATLPRNSDLPSIPEEAAWLLEPFRFRS